MRLIYCTFFILSLFGLSAAARCTLTASGGDDAAQFISAVQSCRTVHIPKTTTLNIETRLNTTGLSDTIIVGSYLFLVEQED